jgi:hypothetical protein
MVFWFTPAWPLPGVVRKNIGDWYQPETEAALF